jgi:hypothetical protein
MNYLAAGKIFLRCSSCNKSDNELVAVMATAQPLSQVYEELLTIFEQDPSPRYFIVNKGKSRKFAFKYLIAEKDMTVLRSMWIDLMKRENGSARDYVTNKIQEALFNFGGGYLGDFTKNVKTISPSEWKVEGDPTLAYSGTLRF